MLLINFFSPKCFCYLKKGLLFLCVQYFLRFTRTDIQTKVTGEGDIVSPRHNVIQTACNLRPTYLNNVSMTGNMRESS